MSIITTGKELAKFINRWKNTHPQHLRLGQAFYNEHSEMFNSQPCPEIFYEENHGIAVGKIRTRFELY